MLRLFLVDDEPIAVDSLHVILVEHLQPDVEIYKAYSAAQALELVQWTKPDIMLCDIQMPELNGFEVAERVLARWPQCKIIFLTGYRDFAYAQNAIRRGGIDYVLKTEGDEAIFRAIEAAKEEITRERSDDQLAYKAKQQLHLALPSLRKDYLLGMLNGDEDSPAERQARFQSLEIVLDPTQLVLPVLGMVDRWEPGLGVSDKSLFLYCIQNIAEEQLSLQLRCTPVQLDHCRFLWLLQPQSELTGEERRDLLVWQDTLQFAGGTLESVQATCRQLLKLPVSLAVLDQACLWERLAESYSALKWRLSNRPSRDQEVILFGVNSHNVEPSAARDTSRIKAEELRIRLKKLDRLGFYLENHQQSEFMETLRELLRLDAWVLNGPRMKYVQLEVFYTISSFLLSCLNRYELTEEFDARYGLEPLLNWDAHTVWSDAAEYFEQAGAFLFASLETKRTNRTNEVIEQVNRYVAEHLAEELSLTKLVEVVHLNSSYLSRLYKQETGTGLLEHITEARIAKAKKLLRASSLKIHEISAEVGLISSTYFARMFKKATGMTPQEYRDMKG